MFPENFLAHLRTIARNLDAVAMDARHRFLHRIDRNARKNFIPDPRHVRHQEVGVLVGDDVGMFAEHLQRDRRSGAGKPADIYRPVDLLCGQAARQHARLEISKPDEERRGGMNAPHAPIERPRHGESLRCLNVALGHNGDYTFSKSAPITVSPGPNAMLRIFEPAGISGDSTINFQMCGAVADAMFPCSYRTCRLIATADSSIPSRPRI